MRCFLLVGFSLLAACAPPPAWRPAGPLPPASRHAPPELRVLVVGDFGAETPQQRRVSDAFRRWHRRAPFDLVLQPGDNVYGCGPNPRRARAERCAFGPDGATVLADYSPPADRLFERNERPLRALRARDGGPLSSYLALGNHDVGAPGFCAVEGMARDEWMRRRACLEVAHRDPQWSIPGRHYQLDRGPVRFIVVDSNVAAEEYGGFTLEGEEAFVREASAPCATVRICFLVAHHPPAVAVTSDWREPMEPGVVRMRRLVAAASGRLAAVIAGHAHALEHLTLDGVDVLIAGAGARGAPSTFVGPWPPEARLHFATSVGGFGVLEAWRGGWGFRLVDDGGRLVECCEADGAGRCEPVRCDAPP